MDDLQRSYEFIAQAAHDLRNPIAVIAGAADLLESRWDKLREDLRREQVASIADQSRRLRELTDALLDWASIETGRVHVELGPVAIKPVVEQVVLDVAPGRPVEVSVPDVRATADATHLTRVLSNLLVNARKYGGPPFRIEGTVTDGELVLTIDDFGPGVPVEIAEDLFEPFVRAGPAGDGVGLGLAIVRGLVEVQGGRVWYERAGNASRFSIAMPVA